MKYILFSVLLILAMLGLAEFLHGLVLLFTAPKKSGVTYSVLALNDENPEAQIGFAAEQRAWMGCSYADHIIALDVGLSEENRARCRDAARRHRMIFCNAEELKTYFLEPVRRR